jgi:hypothetical protein
MAEIQDDEDIFTYSPEQRQTILASIGLPENEIANKLIFGCEMVADTIIYNWDYFTPLPDDRETKQILTTIAWHMDEIIRIASFDGDKRARDKFWGMILLNRSQNLPRWRWNKFTDLLYWNTIAFNYLASIINNDKSSAWIAEKETSILSEKQLTGKKHLKSLAVVYYSALGKIPGRSKSTIGPFIRFAHAAMFAMAGSLTPSIETLNERWARLDFDPSKMRLQKSALQEYSQRRGIVSPF